MLATIRLTGFCLCLTAGYLYSGASSHVTAAQPDAAAKIFAGRLSDSPPQEASLRPREASPGKSDRMIADCAKQAWPYIAPECVARGEVARPAVRTITVSQPSGSAATSLSRVPAGVAAKS